MTKRILFFVSITITAAILLVACQLPVNNLPDQGAIMATATPFQPAGQAHSAYYRDYPTTARRVVETVPTLPPMPTLVVLDAPAIEGLSPTPTSQPLRAEGVPTAQPMPTVQINMDDPAILNLPETVTFLLLGSDTRGGASFRTDTILIVIVRPKDGNVSIISVPRDLWVNIPMVGEQRVNVAYQYGDLYEYPGGGAGLLKDTILYNLGIQIDHVAMVDFNGFRKIVDTIGGIELPVFCGYTDWRLIEPSLDPELEESWHLYTVEPGVVKMDGDLALWYARSRKMSNDFDRGRRQQEVLRAIYQQGLRANLLPRIPQLFSDLSSSFSTDLGVLDLVSMAPLALNLTNANIRGYYIAGDLVSDWVTDQGAYILLPNRERIAEMVVQAMSPSARPQESNKIKIEVLNGSSNFGADSLAAERLNYAGYQTQITAFDRHDYTTTLVYDMTQSQDPQAANAILQSLGLSPISLVANPQASPAIPYAVIVGSDYNACFDPADANP